MTLGVIAVVAAGPVPWSTVVSAAAILFLPAAAFLLVVPMGRVGRGADMPTARVEERDIMFARTRLEPGGPSDGRAVVSLPG